MTIKQVEPNVPESEQKTVKQCERWLVYVELDHPINRGKYKQSQLMFDLTDLEELSINEEVMSVWQEGENTNIPMSNIVLWKTRDTEWSSLGEVNPAVDK